MQTTETVTKGEAKIIYDFVPPEQAAEWARIANSPELKDEWWPDVDDTFSLGNAYYRDMKAERINLYHAGAHHTNQLYNTHLPAFRKAMVSALMLLRHPQRMEEIIIPVARRLTQPYLKRNGPKDMWVDCGIHAVTRESRGGDEPHADYEGLEPFPPLMFSEETVSFSIILCLACPPEGGGIKVWHGRRLGDTADFDPEQETTPDHFLYRPGSLCLFDSFRFHQVQKAALSDEHPARMVGVIHALYMDDHRGRRWDYWF